jgi:hypothetical protein
MAEILSVGTYSPPSTLLIATSELIIEIDGRLVFDVFQLQLQPARMASAFWKKLR